MNWSRLMGVTAAGLALCGCAMSACTAGARQNPGVSATRADKTPDNAANTSTATHRKPVLILNGQLDARPGELVDIRIDGISRTQGRDGVTADSRAFAAPARMRWQDGVYWTVATLAMTDKPGWYPLSVTVAGHTMARDKVQVVRSQRPSFTALASSRVARPGESVSLHFDDLYPGERGTDFTVRSAALPRPVRLVHDTTYDFYNPRAFSAQPELKPGLADGQYTFELYGPHGHPITARRLTVRASRPGQPDYLGKAYGPDFYDPRTGAPDSGHGHDFKVRPGGQVSVVWHDKEPDAGEDTRLTATSPAFTHVLHLNRDSSKSADGDDPRYFNTATVRTDIKPGRYPVTIVAHHGRVKKIGYLIVTAR
ncbi:hypothetical protein ACFYTG_54930 [Streptomyces mirabilis]|uniref:hypothetical protein n=1 Tax=Streptomyces mirabilis TaxID=68239 RepID=UPI0036AD8FEC